MRGLRRVLVGALVLVAVLLIALLVLVGINVISFRAPPPTRDYAAAFGKLAAQLAGAGARTDGAWEELCWRLRASRERGHASLGAGAATPEVQAGAVSEAFVEAWKRVSRKGAMEGEACVRASAVASAMLDEETLAFLDAMVERRVRVVVPAPSGSLLSMGRPELRDARAVARALVFETARAGRAGDTARSLAMLRRSVALGEWLMRDPTLIGYLVGIAITAHACERVTQEASEGNLPKELVRGAFEAIVAVRVPTVEGTLRGERLIGLDAVQGLQGWLEDRLRARNRGVQSAYLDEYYDSLEQALRIDDPAGQIDAFARIEREWEERDAGEVLTGVASILRPAMGAALRSHLQARAQLAGAARVLALESHKAERGEYPARWSELDAALLAKLPHDPFSTPDMGYRLLAPGEDAKGRAYLVYSFGYDGVDNLGVQCAEDKERFWAFGPKGRGFDFVINAVEDEP